MSLIPPELIQQGSSLISLIEAAAHHPYSPHSDDSDSDSDDQPPTPLAPNRSDPTFPDLSHHRSSSDVPVRGANLDKDHYWDSTPDPEMLARFVDDSLQSATEAVARAHLVSEPDEFLEGDSSMDATLPKGERLALLEAEFGPWDVQGDHEEFVDQVPGALYRGILVKGILALTTRRLFIFAYIPQTANTGNKVLRAGPVTVHFPGWLKSRLRCWIELTSDSLSWYRSSTKLHKPVQACRLSQIKQVLPQDEAKPKFVRVELMDGRRRKFELDTTESATAWQADIAAAFFTFRSTADKLRLALPLSLVTKAVCEPYLSLGVRQQLHFDAGICDREGKQSAGPEFLQSIEFGYLKSHQAFGDHLQEQIELAQQRPLCSGVRPILEIDSPMRADEVELQKALAQDQSLASKFVRLFALKDQPSSLYIAPNCEVIRTLPAWGSLAVSSVYLCFWRKSLVGADIRIRIPLVDVDDVVPTKAFGFRIFGLAVQVHGASDVRFDFLSSKVRDEVAFMIKNAAEAASTAAVLHSSLAQISPPTSPLTSSPDPSESASLQSLSIDTTASGTITPRSQYVMPEHRSAFQADPTRTTVLGTSIGETVQATVYLKAPFILGSVTGSRVKLASKHFVCLTIGSRGDVQPYISLGRELMRDGHRVTIASHPEYRPWVESYGIGFKEVGGDPGLLMKLVAEHPLFSPSFFKESLGHFRNWLDTLFSECWAACQDAEVLLESPSTMAGIHVAEALHIPYFRCFTMPWTSTSVYPQAFAAGVGDLGPAYNVLSYKIFESVMWKATAGQVNRWRKRELGLPATSLHKMSQQKIPFIYNFSSAIIPMPLDWKSHIFISGYWFLDDDKPWDPAPGLLEFIEKARADGKPIIYIGFGSIIVPDAAAVTRAVVDSVLKAGVRAILSKGWSTRGDKHPEEIPLPAEIFSVPSVAHDRLFPLIDAAVHHGGAGTTAASLRAGLPTLIHPFFGDQYLWASRVQKGGYGLRIDSLTVKDLTAAFKQGTTDKTMKDKAVQIGTKIRSENGPRAAIDWIGEHINLAQSRIELAAARARNEKPDVPLPTRTRSMFRQTSSPRSTSAARAASLPPAAFPIRTSSDLSAWNSLSAASSASEETPEAKKVSVTNCIVKKLSKGL